MHRKLPKRLSRIEGLTEHLDVAVGGALEVLKPSIERLADNIVRSKGLVVIYERLFGKRKGRKKVYQSDILRAAVVFLHASLEDFLRSLAAAHLPLADEETLNTIPLAGLTRSSRPEKFLLGQLVRHKGRSVDSLISESVQQHLERSNYNSTQEVASLLTSIGIDTSKVNKTFPQLDEMMRRRHQIVHRADRQEERGKGKQIAQSLGTAEVNRWIDACQLFMAEVLAQIAMKGHDSMIREIIDKLQADEDAG